MFVQNEEELANAVRHGEPYIEVERELASQVKKLIRLNAVLWIFSLATLSVAVAAVMQMPVTAGTSGIVSLVAGTSASAVLGIDTVVMAVSIAVAGGGIGILCKLRDYQLEYGKNGKIILYLRH